MPQPAPAPRFSRTPLAEPVAAPAPGRANRTTVLAGWGFDADEVTALIDAGVLV